MQRLNVWHPQSQTLPAACEDLEKEFTKIKNKSKPFHSSA